MNILPKVTAINFCLKLLVMLSFPEQESSVLTEQKKKKHYNITAEGSEGNPAPDLRIKLAMLSMQTSNSSDLVAFLEGSKYQDSKAKVEAIKSESFNLLQETQGEETSTLSDEWFYVQPRNTTEL
ncbi:hypothetical protein PoB_005758500 [Plakobranchus ocellatus]|uniref:Uncharacterized protein n=1 Tax=Plakobranchus ocellatus TaxID=259542 RepID=A0AAV4CHQ3_9GAST|nr:hypothetical protein PoB_005758500 [Plakobranchus ocellatus]